MWRNEANSNYRSLRKLISKKKNNTKKLSSFKVRSCVFDFDSKYPSSKNFKEMVDFSSLEF